MPAFTTSIMGSRSGRARQGFSIIELMGVLAIVAIIGAITAGVLFRRLRVADQEAEVIGLRSLAQAFETVTRDRKLLPSPNDWHELLAPEVDQSIEKIIFSRSGFQRMLLYHPRSALKPLGAARIQTVTGFASASNGVDRVILLSSLGRSLPPGFDPTTTNGFEALWNTRPHERPAGWSSAVLPDPDDLQLEKIDLTPFLHRVTINNLSTSNIAARISLGENGTVLEIPRLNPNAAWESSFLQGTSLNLHGLDGSIVSREFIMGDRTFFYGDFGWGGGGPPRNEVTSAVSQLTADFLNATFPDATNQQRPRAAVDELYRALWSYMEWAEDGFVEGGNNKKQAPSAYVVRSTIARLNQGSLNLIGSGGGGN